MNDLISREEARELMYHNQEPLTEYDLDSLPSIEAEPIVHAHWIEEMWGDGWNEYTDLTCSACRKKFKKFSKTKRCPNCGAKMDL